MMSSISKKRRDGLKPKFKSMGDHKEFLRRITKTLYYGQLPSVPCLSLPVTEISCELWSEAHRGRSLRRLHGDTAAEIARSACVSPCALVLAILYLERLKACNPDYLTNIAPADLFLVSLMVSNKYLQDDGEDDEVICSEWAASGGIQLNYLKQLELEFLNAMDWNMFVSVRSFEDGLLWLEKQVAMKQSQVQGFFTYTDILVSYNTKLCNEFLKSVSNAFLSILVSYVASLVTVAASTVVMSQLLLPTLQYIDTRDSTTISIDTSITNNMETKLLYVDNTTLDHTILNPVFENFDVTEKVMCCTQWVRYQESVETHQNWNDGVVAEDWKLFETWWSRTSVLNWLYQTSLINPLQRWLERIDTFTEFSEQDIGADRSSQVDAKCEHNVKHREQKCIQQWLNLGKLSAILVSVADR